MNLVLNNKILDNLNFEIFSKVWPEYDVYHNFVLKKSGEAHYRLLTYISSQLNNCNIIDIGTNKGASALAFSSNKKNFIYSFDPRERVFYLQDGQKYQQENLRGYQMCHFDNINFIIGSFYNFLDIVLKSPLILYDTDHGGIQEKEFYDILIKNNYKGIVIFDDIYFCKEMTDFWNSIDIKKYDITKYGNHSGTGLVDFNNNINLTLE